LMERVLVDSGIARARVRSPNVAIAILAYHNIVPRGESPAGDRSLHLAQETFGDHLDCLGDTHDIVHLDDIEDTVPHASRPLAAITFDDAYLGTLTAGFDELVKRGLPGTVFANPGAFEWDGFWWDRLADRLTGQVEPGVRSHGLRALAGRQLDILSWARDKGLDECEVPEYAKPAPQRILERAVDTGLIRVGSHTWSHPNLAALGQEEVERELELARRWLESFPGASTSWLAYPYGLQNSLVRAVAARDHFGGLCVSGGPTGISGWEQDRFAAPRLNVPSGVTPRGLMLRLARLR